MTNDELNPDMPDTAQLLKSTGGGTPLRLRREALGLSLADVSAHLKIGPKRVEAIEAGDWQSQLPLPYLRGFVRNYAKLVQIDADPILAQIDVDLGRIAEEAPVSLEAPRLVETPIFDRLRSQTPGARKMRAVLFGALVVLMLGLLVWLLAGPVSQVYNAARTAMDGVDANVVAPPVVPAPAPVQAAPGVAEPLFPPESTPPADGRIEQVLPPFSVPSTGPLPAPGAVPTPAPVPQSAAPATSAAVVVPAPQNAAAGSNLVLRFRDESWVQVRQADGKIVLAQLNRANTEQTLVAKEPIEMVIGNPGAVTLIHRGEPVDLTPHVRKNLARLTLK